MLSIALSFSPALPPSSAPTRALLLAPVARRSRCASQASRAEDEFAHYTSRYHIKRVRRRLLLTSICLTFSCIEPLASEMRSSELVPYLMLKTVGPVVVLALGAVLCLLRPTRPFWRTHVVVSALAAYNGILWSDAVVDVSGWSRASQDYSTVLQCVWMMIASQVRYACLAASHRSIRLVPLLLPSSRLFLPAPAYFLTPMHTYRPLSVDAG